MNTFQNIKSPIVAGGVGGSGTRVIAQMLIEAGVYMGDLLNEPNDNLWFTLLMRRPWLLKNNREATQLKLLEIFRKRMFNEKISFTEKMKVRLAAYEFIKKKYIKNDEWYSLPKKISESLRSSSEMQSRGDNWGWKEPNTHHFIPALAKKFPQIKYLLVMRNGLDMAFSGNQIQLRNFGKHYGVNGNSPADSLEYWIRANNKTIEEGEELLGSNFKVLHLEDLCADPIDETKKLFEWAELKVDGAMLSKISVLPKLPSSTNRYQEKDLTIFAAQQLEAVKQLGYSTEK